MAENIYFSSHKLKGGFGGYGNSRLDGWQSVKLIVWENDNAILHFKTHVSHTKKENSCTVFFFLVGARANELLVR